MPFNQFTRRDFLQMTGAGLAAASLVGAQAESRPNVLFIAIDDLNDWVGFLGGHPNAKTPNLDRLAERSTVFTHAYCAAPLCNPSRAALMTGIQPARSGVYDNGMDWRKAPIFEKHPTLSKHFMNNGYSAIGSGKIFHGPYQDPSSWKEYWPSKEKNRPDDPMPPKTPWYGGKAARAHFDWGPLDIGENEMGDWKVTSWVIDQLNREHTQPFFLACGVFRPHLPWYVPKKYYDMHPLDEIELPPVNEKDLEDLSPLAHEIAEAGNDNKRILGHGKWREAVQSYLACTSFADACVGRVLDALDASPHRDNTMIVLWSDHGWHLGEKLHWRKRTLWEEGTRNLLLFSGTGIAPGQRCDTPVSLLDVYPTLLDLCHLPPVGGLDGQSLRPLLEDPSAEWERPAITTHLKGNHSVRSKRWRYIRYHDGSEELYDHHYDPLEWTNLAGQPLYSDVIDKLRPWLP
ncbi:MAG: sulfatase, partial [Candidatus Omnitrophica bacterium]|nr:sulfatase [Candidatus Omnitrophota bacterium]